jgi:hypothetical protein
LRLRERKARRIRLSEEVSWYSSYEWIFLALVCFWFVGYKNVFVIGGFQFMKLTLWEWLWTCCKMPIWHCKKTLALPPGHFDEASHCSHPHTTKPRCFR